MAARRSERELAEARASGNAPPAVDVKTGEMINPHNPEFITKKPWYLAEGDGGDGGPSLDHQADQRREEDKRGISMAEADKLVREERDRLRKKLEKQKLREKTRKKRSRRSYDDEGAELFELGMWIEALKKNKKPYLIAQIVKISDKGKSFDLKYEDGYIERNVRPWGDKKKNTLMNVNVPRVRITRTGSRTAAVNKNAFGKETYSSKRDSYHGVEIDGHMKKMEEKHRERESLRKVLRQQEKEKWKQEQQQAELEDKEKQGQQLPPSDSDSDSDSDAGGNNDGFSSSEDEVVQRDTDAKLFTSRLARQGGVGGAQMKVTARNLRIREDTAKYLRNLDPNSAYYDPKSRSMRDNPYGNDADDGSNLQQQQQAAESLGFAGDNFSRISGDAVKLAETQLFAWDAEKKLGMEGAVHVQADPSKAELMRKKVETRGKDMKEKKRQAVLDRYGGEEYLEGTGSKSANGGAGAQKETREERATRFGVSHAEQEYGRDGRLAAASSGGAAKQKKRMPIPCKYEEDIYPNGHTAIWGSYFHKGAFQWGFADDHSLIRSSYGTGANGRIANDESNELQYGSGAAGSAMLASARKMLEVIPKAKNAGLNGDNDKFKPNQQSKLYGSAVDQHKEFDKDKLQAAMKRQQQQEEEAGAAKGGKSKRAKYNSLSAEVDVTEEDMEAYRLSKGRGVDDPMAKMGEELLEYKK
ncbi:hypothetical protein ACHAXR_012835 [Thalassiosira sp. AJA248-18]